MEKGFSGPVQGTERQRQMFRGTETNAQRDRDKYIERQRQIHRVRHRKTERQGELETEGLTLEVEVSEAADRLDLWDDRGAALARRVCVEQLSAYYLLR